MSAVDRVIAGAAGATVVVLAGVAGAISYSHMIDLVRLHGEVGWRVHAFPVSVDGIEVVASLVLLAHRRAGTPAGWLPWAALAAGTAASLAANVAVGAADPVGRLVAGWPAVALLVAIKLLSGLLDAGAPVDPHGLGPDGIDRDHRRAHGPTDAAVPTDRPAAPSDPEPGRIDRDQPAGRGPTPGAVPSKLQASPDGLGPDQIGPDQLLALGPSQGTVRPELQHAARRVRDELVAAGATVTRRSLATGLRAAGHRVRNDRLGPLLAAVTQTSTEDGGGFLD
jgi:hypothetical protein